MSFRKTVSIFGVTGSVGNAAQQVILAQPDRFAVQTVSAGKDAQGLAQAAIALKARQAVLADDTQADVLTKALAGTGIDCAFGAQALEEAAAQSCDLVLAATVGFAGLRPILRALASGVNVAIANKEPLVAAGPLVMDTAQKSGAKIIPVDSEHNAVFQVFEDRNRDAIEKIILTASGGPFRTWSAAQMENATPAQALKHPNWVMGPKISVDSATMMNKALEIIEAHYLFSLPPAQIEVLIHPQSIVHGMVCYRDGSTLAQMGASDMRIPIASALAWPERLSFDAPKLDLTQLTFEKPDDNQFPALKLAYECLKAGPHACLALNAANEVAVEAFLAEEIGFGDILRCATAVLQESYVTNAAISTKNIEGVEEYDRIVRRMTRSVIDAMRPHKERKVR